MVEGNGTSINLYRIPAGRSFDMHQHPFAELGVVLAGKASFLIQEEERPIQEGDSYYIPGGVPHGLRVSEGRPVVILGVVVPQLSDSAGPTASEVLKLAAMTSRKDPSSGPEGTGSSTRGKRRMTSDSEGNYFPHL